MEIFTGCHTNAFAASLNGIDAFRSLIVLLGAILRVMTLNDVSWIPLRVPMRF
jgi:hypothetical protein